MKGLAYIYVAGSADGPVRIGYRRHYRDGGGKPVEDILYQVWADTFLAQRVQLGACLILDRADKRISGKLFAVPLIWAKRAIAFVAQESHITLYDRAQAEVLLQQREDHAMAVLARSVISSPKLPVADRS